MATSGQAAHPNEGDHTDASMFDLAPVSLWLEDYSEVRRYFARLRQDGVEDLPEMPKEAVAAAIVERIADALR